MICAYKRLTRKTREHPTALTTKTSISSSMATKNIMLDTIKLLQATILAVIKSLRARIPATSVISLDTGLTSVPTVKEGSMVALAEQKHMAEVVVSMEALAGVLRAIRSVSTVKSKAIGPATVKSQDVKSLTNYKVAAAIKGLNRTD